MARNVPPRANAVRLLTAENGESPDNGTALANYSDTTSCTLAQPDSQRGTWGGARNRADRVSYNLSDEQVQKLMESARHAFETGRVFQRHWTVHYGLAGIQPHDGARFVGSLIDKISKQSKREGGKLSAIWVRECASEKGEHVHILLHLPDGMTLRNRTRRWIVQAGGEYRAGVSRVAAIGGRIAKVGEDSKKRQVTNAENVVRYLLKASKAETGERLALTRWGLAGKIIGKRWGRSNNLRS